jgi:hypothetical protein
MPCLCPQTLFYNGGKGSVIKQEGLFPNADLVRQLSENYFRRRVVISFGNSGQWPVGSQQHLAINNSHSAVNTNLTTDY